MSNAEVLFSLPGYEFLSLRHARAILSSDYGTAVEELSAVLSQLHVHSSDVVAGGGGKSQITQSIETPLKKAGWTKKVFNMSQSLDGHVLESTTHEIDHFKAFDDRPGIALEIEWNNKDPFFDRDLAAFTRLHALGLISVGIIITRGSTLKDALRKSFLDYYLGLNEKQLEEVIQKLGASSLARVRRITPPQQLKEALADLKFTSKFGEATTHWKKLMDRLDRGLGNPCPLLCIGIQSDRLDPD